MSFLPASTAIEDIMLIVWEELRRANSVYTVISKGWFQTKRSKKFYLLEFSKKIARNISSNFPCWSKTSQLGSKFKSGASGWNQIVTTSFFFQILPNSSSKNMKFKISNRSIVSPVSSTEKTSHFTFQWSYWKQKTMNWMSLRKKLKNKTKMRESTPKITSLQSMWLKKRNKNS